MVRLDETLNKANGIEINKLTKLNNDRVHVTCDRCNESFIREYRYVDQPHSCNGVFGLSSIPRIECKLLDDNAVLPKRSNSFDAGYDLTAIENVTLKPGKITNIRTGVVMSAPEGYYFTVEGRSSLFKRGIFPARGIIDSTYTGEMLVALVNFSDEDYKIEKGNRIAQIILHSYLVFDAVMIDNFSESYSHRGEKGFGSTGR